MEITINSIGNVPVFFYNIKYFIILIFKIPNGPDIKVKFIFNLNLSKRKIKYCTSYNNIIIRMCRSQIQL